MGLFLGTHICKVDRKGRVSVPAQFRAVLANQNFDGIILYPSPVQPGVVEGCSMAYLEQMAAASARQFDVFSDETDDIGTAIYASSVQLAWDPEGRVLLPESIISHAGVAEQAAFVGLGTHFQLWQPAAHAARKQEATQRLRQSRPKLLLQPPHAP